MTDLEKLKKELELPRGEVDSHETDLYIKYTPERMRRLELRGFKPGLFRASDGSGVWIELPFFLIDDKIKGRSKT